MRFLGKALGVAPSALRILAGSTARNKVVAVEGLEAAAVRARLGR